MTEALPGAPVIWNHTGTDEHVNDGRSFQELGKGTPIKGPVGKVVAAWHTDDGGGRAVIDVSPRIGALLGTGAAPGVSLTHGTNDKGTVVPVELSIVNRPARPGAVVEQVFGTPAAAHDYIQRMNLAATTATMAESAAAPMETTEATPSAVELGVNSIADETQRKAVQARMEEMATCAMESTKTMKDLQAELDLLKQQAGTDAAATKEAVEMFVDAMGPEVAQRWRLGQLAQFDKPEWPANFVRNMVMASHDRVMALTRSAEASDGGRAAKRQRETAPAKTPARTQSNPLRAALASTFHA